MFYMTLCILDESELQPVYGCPLEDHLRIQEREIAFVIEECVTFLYREAMDVQVRLLAFNHFTCRFLDLPTRQNNVSYIQ